MTGVANPWLPQPSAPETSSAQQRSATAEATGPVHPQHGVPAPDLVDQLPVRRMGRRAALWVIGTHGGAAESIIAELDDTWVATSHVWPAVTDGDSAQVILVARTSARGLLTAKAASKQWAAGLVPGIDVLGLVLVADAPGRLPKPLRDLIKVVGGGYPRTWQVPWVESCRIGEPLLLDTAPREVRRLVDNLRTLQAGASSGAHPHPPKGQ